MRLLAATTLSRAMTLHFHPSPTKIKSHDLARPPARRCNVSHHRYFSSHRHQDGILLRHKALVGVPAPRYSRRRRRTARGGPLLERPVQHHRLLVALDHQGAFRTKGKSGKRLVPPQSKKEEINYG